MGLRHSLTFACAVLLLPMPSLAQQTESPLSAQQAGSPPSDFFKFGVRAGVQAFHYEEKDSPVKSDYDSYGYAAGVNALLRIPTTRLTIGADFLASVISDDTETWRNIPTSLGAGTQKNDLDVDMYVFDVDLGYAIVKQRNLEWLILGGWHYYSQTFSRSNFFTTVGGTLVSALDATVTEDVRGQGLKIGTSVEGRIGERFVIEGAVAGYYLYDVDVKNSVLGRLSSEGYAGRLRVGLDYLLTDYAAVGLGYEGHYIHVDRATSAIAILPENQTWANTLTVRFGVRY